MAYRVYGAFTGRPRCNPDWEECALIAQQVGIHHAQLDMLVEALHACRKYSRTCQLVKGYQPNGLPALYLVRLGSCSQQPSPALDTLSMWLPYEERINRLFTWLHETARISYRELAAVQDSPF